MLNSVCKFILLISSYENDKSKFFIKTSIGPWVFDKISKYQNIRHLRKDYEEICASLLLVKLKGKYIFTKC